MVNKKIDNFDFVLNNLCNNIKDGKFLYVELLRRKKDEPIQNHNEHGYIEDGTAFKIHSKEELSSLKENIIHTCDEKHRRAHISCNPLSQELINKAVERAYIGSPAKIKKEKTKEEMISGFEHMLLNDYHGMIEKEDYSNFIIDIDIANRDKWNDKKKILLDNNAIITKEYETPSGGLHVLVSNINTDTLFKKIKRLIDEDHIHIVKENAKMTLYANVNTAGY